MDKSIIILPQKQAETTRFAWGHLTWFAGAGPGNSEDMTIGRCVLSPGESNPRHYHPNCSEVLVVMKGRILHTDGEGGETEMNEGDTVTILPRVWHRATNVGNEEAVLFIAFSSANRETVGE